MGANLTPAPGGLHICGLLQDPVEFKTQFQPQTMAARVCGNVPWKAAHRGWAWHEGCQPRPPSERGLFLPPSAPPKEASV